MNKVVTIHLNGIAHQLEEAGYEALRAYLDSAAKQLSGNPDKDEIIADIEQSISDKFRSLTSPQRNVVLAKDVAAVLAAMGPVDDGSTTEESGDPGEPEADSKTSSSAESAYPPPKRLYRIQEGAMVSGVCNGIGAYFGIDPTIIRITWIVLSFFTAGIMIGAYFVMVLVVPQARTQEEHAAAQGAPATAQEFINRARAGYYEAAKKFGDRAARREWKRRFRDEMHQWRRNFQREMHAPQWWHYKPSFTMAPAGVGFTIALLTFLSLALTLVWVFALLSLLLKGSILGLTPPDGMPIWLSIILLCILYKLIASPIHVSRHALQHGGWNGVGMHCGGGLLETLVGLLFLALGLWLIDRYVPHAHEFFVQIPPVLEKATADLREWWAHRT